MNYQALKNTLRDLLSIQTSFSLLQCSGGDTHKSFHLLSESKAKSYFVKVNSLDQSAVLESEGESLRLLAKLFPDAYPTPVAQTITEELTILVMSFHQLGPISAQGAEDLGVLLARQHAIHNQKCGWFSDNFIGSSVQKNSWSNSWIEFFLKHRLQPQLTSAMDNGLPTSLANKIASWIKSPPNAMADHKPKFALLHGDLWSGNAGYIATLSRPLLFDPAPYYGDPEADLAMTELFGRFPAEFYSGYHRLLPVQRGYQTRREFYNLYHALNHFNLFGGSYLSLIESHLHHLELTARSA